MSRMVTRTVFATEEERREGRRLANWRYDHSEKGRAAHARANADPKAKERYARYRQTAGYAAAQERFKASGGRNRLALASRATVRAERPELIAAWMAVQVAIRSGAMVRATECQECGRTLHLVAHHHLGYAPEHWLDVLWLCRRCHKAAHAVTTTS